MTKILVVGSILTAGTGAVVGGLALSGARNSQKDFPKSEEVKQTSESAEVVVPKVSDPKCKMYEVKTSDSVRGQAILRDEGFWNGEKISDDGVLTQSIKGVCGSSGKVYIAKQDRKWVYRDQDQTKQWTEVDS